MNQLAANLARIAVTVDLSSTDFTTSNPSGLAVYVGGSGNVKVDTISGSTGITFTTPVVGQILPVLVSKIYKTGTTATGLVALS